LPIKFAARLTACFAVAGTLALSSFAQQQPPQPPTSGASQTAAPAQPTPSAQPDQSQGAQDSKGKVEGTSNDRLFFALPNFLTVSKNGRIVPLTTKQKFQVVALGSFDYVQYPWYAFLSGISQAENSEAGYGQGWEGYGKRFGSALADGTIENFMTGAVLPSIFHQDPRFFPAGQGSFTHRAGYAVSRIFVTRGDTGRHEFNASEVLGSALSASISTYSYHPRSEFVSTPSNPHLFIPSDRTLKNTASVWGSQLGYDTLTIVVKEFWPDIHRKLVRKHPSEAVGKNSTP
jgi:hypothetical protein